MKYTKEFLITELSQWSDLALEDLISHGVWNLPIFDHSETDYEYEQVEIMAEEIAIDILESRLDN